MPTSEETEAMGERPQTITRALGTETTRPAGPPDLACVKLALSWAPTGGRQLIALEPPTWRCTIPPGVTLIEYLGVEHIGSECTPCTDCGIDYAAVTGARLVSDRLWQGVVGSDGSIALCPSCFLKRVDATEVADAKAIIAAMRHLQDRSIGSPEANERALNALVGALSVYVPHEHDWGTERETDVTYAPHLPKVMRSCLGVVGPAGDRRNCAAVLIDGVTYEPVP